MVRRLFLWIRKHWLGIDDRSQLEIAIENGMKVGQDCHIMGECILDPGHCWLIEIGDRVTIAPRCHILAHDASTKRELGHTRIAPVTIGNDVFVGAGSIILPGVTIGNKVIIGAGSVVSRSIPDNSLAVGVPCRVIGSYEDYIETHRNKMRSRPCFDASYKIGVITDEKKARMKDLLDIQGEGYVE